MSVQKIGSCLEWGRKIMSGKSAHVKNYSPVTFSA